ncbi:hypothetical protein [Roseibacillus persicicus]|nr:hypothetical protein [Roseibacillus persicicus]
MKTLVATALFLTLFLNSACREKSGEKEGAAKMGVAQVRFSPAEGETWTYKAEVKLDPSARFPAGLIDTGPEGSASTFQKTRRYLGLMPVTADSDEKAHCFEISKDGRVEEREFSIFNEEGILARAWQKAGGERMVIEPTVLVPAQEPPGSVWSREVPDPNNPSGSPMFSRQFQYFGKEQLQVMGQSQTAHRVKISGKTGPLHLQRDLWFVDNLGFVKERKAYYLIIESDAEASSNKRIALIEEILVQHEIPEK